MMQERATGHGQPESRTTRPAEIFVIFVTAQFGITVEITNGIKNPLMHHETDAVRDIAAIHVIHSPHKIRRVRR